MTTHLDRAANPAPQITPSPIGWEAQHATVRNRAVALLNSTGQAPSKYASLGSALLAALVHEGVDLAQGPNLEEMKSLLVEVYRLARA